MKYIIITTIASPTPAVRSFASIPGWHTVVVGDKKTPPEWSCPAVEYLAPRAQQDSSFTLSRLLPWNHYCRKTIGYLHAIQQGAELIVDTDDDNLPMANWGFEPFDGNFFLTTPNSGFLNVYRFFSDQFVWPRGFPLRQLRQSSTLPHDPNRQFVRVGVWQALADGDPDVDAIYRLVFNHPVFFQPREPVVLGKGTICPFNSQNTAFRKELFALMYLPCHVNFRFTDILRGLVAQPIMWAADFLLGFTHATVVQERNPHDYLEDFRSEIPCFLHAEDVIAIVQSAIKSSDSVEENLYSAYSELCRAKIVAEQEIGCVSAWLADLARARQDSSHFFVAHGV